MPTALSLSGGGFRATLFHLGVIAYLREADRLREVTDIASVSGGSIVAAHLSANWSRYLDPQVPFDDLTLDVMKLIREGFRGRVRIFRTPSKEFSAHLARIYSRDGQTLTLGDLSGPEVHLLATGINRGLRVWFCKAGGFALPQVNNRNLPAMKVSGDWLGLNEAIAASAAFPGYFHPVAIAERDINPYADTDELILCQDGGVIDNTGLQDLLERPLVDAVIFSDAGKILTDQPSRSLRTVFASTIRSLALSGDLNRTGLLNSAAQRWGAAFIHIDINEPSLSSENIGYDQRIAGLLGAIRTDLNAFSKTEREALLHHGYSSAARMLHVQSPLPRLVLRANRPFPVDAVVTREFQKAARTPHGVESLIRLGASIVELAWDNRRLRRVAAWLLVVVAALQMIDYIRVSRQRTGLVSRQVQSFASMRSHLTIEPNDRFNDEISNHVLAGKRHYQENVDTVQYWFVTKGLVFCIRVFDAKSFGGREIVVGHAGTYDSVVYYRGFTIEPEGAYRFLPEDDAIHPQKGQVRAGMLMLFNEQIYDGNYFLFDVRKFEKGGDFSAEVLFDRRLVHGQPRALLYALGLWPKTFSFPYLISEKKSPGDVFFERKPLKMNDEAKDSNALKALAQIRLAIKKDAGLAAEVDARMKKLGAPNSAITAFFRNEGEQAQDQASYFQVLIGSADLRETRAALFVYYLNEK